MKGIILLNGEPYSGEIDAGDALVYCCDGAYGWAKGRVRIDENVGDFDSLSEIPYPAPKEIYPSEKNFTDGEIALFKLLERDVTSIEIYGGGGKREDHFLGNLHLLYKSYISGVPAKMICNGAVVFAASGRIDLKGYAGATLSVLPFGAPLHIIESAGLKYSYPETLGYGECRGLSNVAESDTAYVVTEGIALVIINGGIL